MKYKYYPLGTVIIWTIWYEGKRREIEWPMVDLSLLSLYSLLITITSREIKERGETSYKDSYLVPVRIKYIIFVCILCLLLFSLMLLIILHISLC